MYEAYDYSGDNMTDNQNDYSLPYTDEIFKAFADAILPRTPGLAEEFGRIQYFGALDLYTDEYLIMSFNHYYIPLAEPIAQMLETAAKELVFAEGPGRISGPEAAQWSTFGELAPTDRLRALTLLEQGMVNTSDLPEPFQDNQDYILYILNALNRFTLMGYYSEWSGYGSTRLEAPSRRSLEYFPLSWEQVGYPGPSLGYRALR
jgi:hypothetical protein